MIKPKKYKVARDFDAGTKTRAEFFGRFRAAIRKIWMFSSIRKAAMQRAKCAPGRYLCSKCNKIFKATEVEVNHSNGCGPYNTFEDFGKHMAAMFDENLDGLEVLCKVCHKEFTKQQRAKK